MTPNIVGNMILAGVVSGGSIVLTMYLWRFSRRIVKVVPKSYDGPFYKITVLVVVVVAVALGFWYPWLDISMLIYGITFLAFFGLGFVLP